jgi:phenylalanyl-tRNA synthetase alpha chain
MQGLIADKGLTLGHLMGTISQFFKRLGTHSLLGWIPLTYLTGIENLRFKPAYNPYTEPSMEVFGYHPILKRWVEVGNSGVFRPEMLRPMGFPDDVKVIAWGLSLERYSLLH